MECKLYKELVNLVNSLEGDVDKFYGKGVSAAAVRVRKGLLEIKTKAQAMRVDIQAKKQSFSKNKSKKK